MITIRKSAVVLIVLLVIVLGLGAQGCGDEEDDEGLSLSPVLTQGVRHSDDDQWAELSRQFVIVTAAHRSSIYNFGPINATKLPPPGTEFIVIKATIINRGNTSLAISPGNFIIKDTEGNRFTYTVYRDDRSFPSISLQAGKTTNGMIPFLVPDWATGLEVSYIGPGAQENPPTWSLS